MKFNKMMTKVLSALIMVSMVGTSVQVPTLAEVTNAGRAIVAGTVEDKAKDASGSTESKDAGAADDEDNKNQNDAENAENNKQAAASDSNAQNNTENSSKGGANTSSVSGAKNNSSSSSSYNNISSSSDTSNKSTSTSQVLEPFSKDNDSDKLSFDKDFSLFSYFGQTQTFSAIAANGDGSDIEWQVEPKFFSISTPKVDGAKSTVDITWDKEKVEDMERTPFYAMLKSNPYEKITGTIYLSNGQAPSKEEQQQDAGSKKEFESEEVKNFVEDMYKTGLTQENSVYDLSLLGDTNNNTGATDFSNMSDEEILKAFEEKQNSENADNKDNTETLSDTKTETTENTTDKTDKVADLDKDAKVDADKSEETASDNALYNRKETQSKVSENELKADAKADSNTDSKPETKQDTSVIDNNEKSAANDNTKTDVKAETKAIAKPETTKTETSDNEKLSEVTSKELTETTTQVLSNATNNTTNSETKTSDEVGEDDFVTVQSEETAEPETKTVTETVEVPTTKTVEQEVQKEVSKTKQVATTTTKTTTTEIVSQEPIVETKTKTVYEEVPAEKEVTVEKQVAVGEDEETGETQYETVSETTTVQSTETVAKEETVEEQVGTNTIKVSDIKADNENYEIVGEDNLPVSSTTINNSTAVIKPATPENVTAKADKKTNNIVLSGTTADFEYSTDNGATWVKAAAGTTTIENAVRNKEYTILVRTAATTSAPASDAATVKATTYKYLVNIYKNGAAAGSEPEYKVYTNDEEINAVKDDTTFGKFNSNVLQYTPSRFRAYFTDSACTTSADVANLPKDSNDNINLYYTAKKSSGGGGGGGSSVSIKLDKDTVSGVVGDKIKVTATVTGSTAKPTWTSSNEDVATVDENGNITFVGKGTATVKVKVNGIVKNIPVTVKEATATPVPTVKPTEAPVINTEYTKPYASGYDDGSFLPNNNITRGELAAMIARLSYGDDLPDGMYQASFPDVDSDAWFNKYIGYLEDKDVLSGYEDGTFRPMDTITRGEISAVIARAQRYDLISYNGIFTDVTENDWAKDYIETLADKNIVSGYEDGTFGPYSPLTRAEAVAIINRVLVESTPIVTFTPNDIAGHWAEADILLAVNERMVGANAVVPTVKPEETAAPEETVAPEKTTAPEATPAA